MNAETDSLVEAYIRWLRENSTERDLEGGWKELTFPFLDRHNDFLQVFAQSESTGLRITDEGRTIRDVRRAGCDIAGPTRRRAIAETILRGLGLDPALIDGEEIAATAINGDFPWKLHGVLQSMLAIDGLANMAPPIVASIFEEDVARWLGSIGAAYTRDPKLAGRTGVEHTFDFIVRGGPGREDRILEAIPNPDKLHVQSFAYEAVDTMQGLGDGAPKFYVMVGGPKLLTGKPRETMLKNGIDVLAWENRQGHAEKFRD